MHGWKKDLIQAREDISKLALTSFNGYITAPKQRMILLKTASRTSVAGIHFTVFDLAGNPGAGVLNPGNTVNGIVPTDALAGYPVINAFNVGALGYLSRVTFGSTVACRLVLFDRLFMAGAYAFNADVPLSAQPDFGGRVPDLDYKGLELWVEAVTAFTGTPSVQLDYLDQDGNPGDTGVVSLGAALTLGRCQPMPLASGDVGIRRLDRVRGTVATVGTFNVMILRRLWEGRVPSISGGGVHDVLQIGLPQLFTDSALYLLVAPDSTATGIPALTIEIVND